MNIFDKGVIANVAEFFDHDILFFWLPLTRDVKEDGTFIERSPICTPEDLRLHNAKLHGDKN